MGLYLVDLLELRGGKLSGPFVLDTAVLENLAAATLYYPNAARDGLEAIELFSPYVTDFYFVDFAYFGGCRGRGFGAPADRVSPFLNRHGQYRLIGIDFSEGPLWAELETRIDLETGRRYNWVEPCTRSERYVHTPSGREVTVHRRRGSAVVGLKKLIQDLGVFYYRGDGSEGSATPWLTVRGRRRSRRFPFDEVLDRIVDKGLVVTDGSWCEYGEYLEFRRAARGGEEAVSEAIAGAQPFTDGRGFSYQCIGYAGHRWRHAPTLIWQVHRPDPS